MTPDLQLLTIEEVATRFRLSKMTIYRMVYSGELQGYRLGKSFRVPEVEVTRYLASHRAYDAPQETDIG